MDVTKKKITVVTVCYNAGRLIERTLRSVACQDYSDFEYLIIDGKSTDDTLQVARKYSPFFGKRGINFRIISEPDDGIYDAMNKAAQKALGEWVIYLNAGDTFYRKNVLKTAGLMLNDDIDVLHGDVLIYDNNLYKLVREKDEAEMLNNTPINHQSTFARTELVRKYRFNTRYKCGADYDLFLRMYLDNVQFKREEFVVSIFLLGGFSYQNSNQYQRDMYCSRKMNHVHDKHCLWFYLFYDKVFHVLREIGRTVIKPIFYSRKRGWYSEKYCAEKNGRNKAVLLNQ